MQKFMHMPSIQQWPPVQVILRWLKQIDEFAQKYHLQMLCILAVLYKVALDAMYTWAVSPGYSYEGIVYTPNFWKYAVSWIFYLIILAYLPKQENSTPVFLLHLQMAYIFAPILTYYGLANGSSKYMLMVFFCIMLQIFIVKKPVKTMTPIYISGIKNYVSVCLLILLIPTLLIPILYNGFAGLKAFDLTYYKTIRKTSTYPVGFGYLFHFMAKAIVPFFTVYFLYFKKYALAGITIVIQVILYMESGFRGILLFVIPILAVFFLSKSRHLIKLMYGGFSALFFLIIPAAKMDSVGGHLLGRLLNSYIGERAIGGSGVNKFLYYNCFSHYPKTYFSDGLIGKMLGLTYPYNSGSGQIIYAFGGGEYMRSNSIAGYIGESYGQLGFLGMVLMSMLLAFIFRSLYLYDRKENFGILTSIFSIYIIILTDAPLFTTMLSGGMIVSYLLIFIYLNQDSKGAANGIHRI